jgi:L-fuconolactonase
MVTEADWLSWNPQDLYPFLDIVFDAFGTDRLMIGSDWPVCNLAGSYGQVMGILPEFMERREMPDSDRIKVLYDNGFKFYNLK